MAHTSHSSSALAHLCPCRRAGSDPGLDLDTNLDTTLDTDLDSPDSLYLSVKAERETNLAPCLTLRHIPAASGHCRVNYASQSNSSWTGERGRNRYASTPYPSF